MARKITTIILIVLIYTSCGIQKPQEADVAVLEITHKTIVNETTSEIPLITSESPPITDFEEAGDNDTGDIEWFPVFPDEKGNYRVFVYGEIETRLDYFSDGLQDLVGKENFENWRNGFKTTGMYTYLNESFDINTSLSQSANLYTFLVDFDVDSDKFIKLLEEDNRKYPDEYKTYKLEGYRPEYYYVPGHNSDYFFTQEQFEALTSRSEEDVLNLFTGDNIIIKGKNYYSPGWFFYNSIDDYKDVGITSDDITKMINIYRNTHRILPETIVYFEDKATNYLLSIGEIFQISEIFGYDRDINMPFPYKRSIMGKAATEYFHNPHSDTYMEYYFDKCHINKNDESYSPHWVYYNKPETYKAEGLTPDELIAMLPKYKELDILTEEAMTALENKLYGYRDGYGR